MLLSFHQEKKMICFFWNFMKYGYFFRMVTFLETKENFSDSQIQMNLIHFD